VALIAETQIKTSSNGSLQTSVYIGKYNSQYTMSFGNNLR